MYSQPPKIDRQHDTGPIFGDRVRRGGGSDREHRNVRPVLSAPRSLRAGQGGRAYMVGSVYQRNTEPLAGWAIVVQPFFRWDSWDQVADI